MYIYINFNVYPIAISIPDKRVFRRVQFSDVITVIEKRFLKSPDACKDLIVTMNSDLTERYPQGRGVPFSNFRTVKRKVIVCPSMSFFPRTHPEMGRKELSF